MGTEIHVKPSALARKVTGTYVSPEQARINRLMRRFRKATDEEVTEAAHKVPITDEGRAALQVMKERGEAASYEKEKALIAEVVKKKAGEIAAQSKQALPFPQDIDNPPTPMKSWWGGGSYTYSMGKIDQKMYSLITGGTPTSFYVDPDPLVNEFMQYGSDPHPKIHEAEGGKVAELVLKVGPHEIPLGAAVTVKQETVVTSDQPLSLTASPGDEIKFKPQYHAKMTFEMKDWSEVLKALGWKPTCGNHSAGCHNWSHYAPPK